MITFFKSVAQISKESKDFSAGSPEYRAPEKIYGDRNGNMKPYDNSKESVFGIGLTLIHIHAGRTPFSMSGKDAWDRDTVFDLIEKRDFDSFWAKAADVP